MRSVPRWRLVFGVLLFCSCIGYAAEPATNDAKPTLFLIGDSTVRNGTKGLQGWGDPLAAFFETNKIRVLNRALGGRSSRTFLTEGLWAQVEAALKPGDFVLMQFGHNDGGPLDDGRARASLKGIGDNSVVVTNRTTAKVETVHSYGWYLRQYIRDAKAKSATPIVLSPVPRNMWKDGKVARASADYGKWAAAAAAAESAGFVDLNEIIARHYEALGADRVKKFFPGDHTHTNPDGARLNAACVVEGLRSLTNCALVRFLRDGRVELPAPGAPLRFCFVSNPAQAGGVRVEDHWVYSSARGFGFEDEPLPVGTPPQPRRFSVALPEGNYDVQVTFGHTDHGSTNTVKAESRRLMLERVVTRPGQFVTRAFTVNIRTPALPDGGAVRLKPRERGVLHWDEKLTLEFNGSSPAVAAVDIAPATNAITVFLLGDSTVTDQPDEPWNSWGQMLTRFFQAGVAVANHAESGESLRSSLNAGRVKKVLGSICPGDYLFVQFGHNDMKERATNALAIYKANLKRLVADARGQGATPVLVTSMERMSGVERDTLSGYPQTVRDIAAEDSVPLIDLHAMSRMLYRALGADPKAAFQDGTHHNAYGSYELAKCVVHGIRENRLPLTRFLVTDVPDFDPRHPDPVEEFNVPASATRSTAKPEGN